jgi:hypothetical protein
VRQNIVTGVQEIVSGVKHSMPAFDMTSVCKQGWHHPVPSFAATAAMPASAPHLFVSV